MKIFMKLLTAAALSLTLTMQAAALGAFVVGMDDDAADGSRKVTFWAAWNENAQSDANRIALNGCAGADATIQSDECRVVLSFDNEAVAVVWVRETGENEQVYYAKGADRILATRAAVANCRAAGHNGNVCRRTFSYADGADAPLSATPPSRTKKDSNGKRLAFAAAGAAVAGLAVYAFGGGTAWQDTSFAPVAEYSLNDGIRRYQVGSRMEWQKDNWTAHWQTTKSQNIANSDGLAFGSGVGWTGDIVAAEFISRSIADKSETTFSLSAEKIFGLWTLSPEYRLDYRTSETDKTLLHALSANAVWQGDKWTVRHSLGLSGESFAAFAKNATAKIQLRREF